MTFQQTETLRESPAPHRLTGGRVGKRPAITPADRGRPLPLSFGQRQLWFLNRLAPDSAEYLVPLVLRLRGPLDRSALHRTWSEIVARHEILRTRYEMPGDQPIQVIDPAEAPKWTTVDLGDLPSNARESRAMACASEQVQLPFDLEREHPLRLTLVRLADDDHLLVAVFHHIASDQVSQQVLLGELGALYHAFTAGLPVPLPPPAVQYADFAAWQQEWFSDDKIEHHLRYWREQLAGLSRLELPTDRPRPAVRGWRGAATDVRIRAATAQVLRDLAISHNATPFMVLLTAFQCLLARYTGQDDVTVGTVVAARADPGLAGTVGYLIDNLALRLRIQGSPSFSDVLDLNRATVLDAFDHQDVPFARLVDDLQPERDMSVTPLFQAAVTMHELPPTGTNVAGLWIDHVELPWQVAKVDLALRLAELPDGGLGAVFEYATDLFESATVARFAAHFARLLDAIAADPGGSVRELDFLLDDERELLVLGSGRQVPTPDRPLHEVFSEQVARTPDAPAVVFDGSVLSYAQLNARANRLAHHLSDLGAGVGRLVGVCLDRDGDLVPTLLGVTKSGAGYLPLDPAYPANRLEFMISDAAVEIVVTTSRHLDSLRAFYSGTVVVLDTDAGTIATSPEVDPVGLAGPGDLAYVIYTSGSTGRPKGVRVTHANVLRLFTSSDRHFDFGADDVWSMFHSYAFDVSVWEMWGALLHGGQLVLVPFDVSRSPEDFLALLADNGVTILSQTPSAFQGLVKLADAGSRRLDRLSLRAVVFAGEKLELPGLAPWIKRFGLTEPALINMYGITETTVHSTFHQLVEADLAPGAGNPIGYPLDDLRIHLLDQHGQLVPIGVPGEIYVGGPGVTMGYLNRPELTGQRFVSDSYGPPGSRLYRSGDLARRLPDGSLQFLGRIDHQVKLRGFRIELGEITSALSGHPGVREAVVVLREDAPGDKRLVAYLVSTSADVPDPGALRELLGKTLPDYMIPAAFVVVDQIPLTPNGKLDQRALPAPDEAAIRAHGKVVPPRTVTEVRLVAVWREVLGVDTVSVHDGFFDLGGDSIRAVSLVGSLKVEGFDLSVRDVFEHRTVARLAEFLDQQATPASVEALVEPFALISAADRALLESDVADAYPMAQLQIIMLLEMARSVDNRYHNLSSFKVKDLRPFDLAKLRAVGQMMVDKHEILRTSLHLEGFSVPMQQVHAQARMDIGMQDLRGMGPDAAMAAIGEWSKQERKRLFDVERPSLLRYFAHVVDDGWWVSITECHPILEGWSYHSLLMELLTTYFELVAGQPAQLLPPAAVRYADFIAAELKSLESEDRAYWRDIVQRYSKFELPSTWRGDGPPERYRLDLPCADIMDSLRGVARKADVSVKAVLHAAYLKVTSMLTDSAEFFTGLVCDTRPEVLGADQVAGMYLNTVPFPFDRSARTWRELVQQTFARHVELWPHRRFPLFEIHREVGAAGRLMDTFFIYLDFHVVDADLVETQTVIDDSPNEFAMHLNVMRDVLLMHTNTAVLSRANGEQLMAMFRAVLEAMVADVDGDAHQTFLDPAQRGQVLNEWNQTEQPQDGEGVVERLRALARQTPLALAVVDDRERLTYRALAGRASAVSERLASAPVGSIVPILADQGAEFVTAVLGVLGAGGAYIPLDTAAPLPRTAKLLADSGARMVLAGPDHVAHARAAADGLAIDVLVLDQAEHSADEWVPARGDEQDLAYVIYTSGSTGEPKGAMVHRRGMVNHLLAKVEDLELDESDIVAQNAPLTFDVSVWQMLGPLISGGQVRAVNRAIAADPAALFATVEHDGVTVLEVVPSLLRAALDDWEAGGRQPDLTGLRWLVVTGEALPPGLCTRWFDRFPAVPLVNAYGPTECSDDVTHAFLTVRTSFDRPLVPIGRPLRNTRLYVLDPLGQPVPVGIPGELHVGGTGVGRGYLNDPERTALAFVEDPFTAEPDGLMYRTGDRVRQLPDGQLEFLGRRDNQVKIRGQRVELGEIEAALKVIPGVLDAAAKVDANRLVGYVVGTADPADVRRHLVATQPEHLVPTALVALPELPLTANGKVDREALPAPDRSALAGGVVVPPRTATEAQLVEVWRTVLGLDDVGVEDDFFLVGGDSIRTLTLVSAMRAGGFGLSVRDVFERRTIAGLAEQLAQRTRSASTSDERALVWLRPKAEQPPLFCVHPQGGSAHWFVPLAADIGAGHSVAAFEAPASVGDSTVDLSELAARYVREMSPEGPYFLLGWSSAATLAWEMAGQLDAAGKPATALILIDPTGDPTMSENPVTTDVVTERLAALLGEGASTTDEEVATLLRLAGLHAAESDRDATLVQVNRTRALTRAMYSYRYPSTTTPVCLVITDECAERDHGVLRGRSYEEYSRRWAELATGGVTVDRVPGGHDEILGSARATELAHLLGALMTGSSTGAGVR